MSASTETLPRYSGLRSTRFDRAFVVGIPAIAIASAVVVSLWPALLWPVIAVDIWLLGYQHVIATWTRIGFDRESWAKYWPLMVLLPPFVFGVVLALGLNGGGALLNTIYFHWLWFHYVRQSEGVSKAYAASCGGRSVVDEAVPRITFYLVPTVALLTLSTFGQKTLLNMPLMLLALPLPLLAALWAGALVALVLSGRRLVALFRAGQLSREYLAYIASHYIIFIAAYACITNTTVAWLCLNIWHNLQYLSFVWLSHQRRFRGQLDARAPLLSTLALPKNLGLYIGACLCITVVFYLSVDAVIGMASPATGGAMALATLIAYQTINFHHYIVDAIIWRRPKRPSAQANPA